PPESRGLRRDGVRLLVAGGNHVQHARFHQLGDFLSAGDVLVVNTSATLPAAVDGRRSNGAEVVVHFSTKLDAADDAYWIVEIRPPGAATGPIGDARAGEAIALPAAVVVVLESPLPRGEARRVRLWRARVISEGGATRFLRHYGRPITYS